LTRDVLFEAGRQRASLVYLVKDDDIVVLPATVPLRTLNMASDHATRCPNDQGFTARQSGSIAHRQSSPYEVRRHLGDNGGGPEHGAIAGPGFRRADVALPDPTDDRLDDGGFPVNQIEPTDPQGEPVKHFRLFEWLRCGVLTIVSNRFRLAQNVSH
jgi:hypothetical protein